LAEATVLLDFPVETNGRRQRGLAIASYQDNIVVDGPGRWEVIGQSGDDYIVTPTHCNCPDGNAPRDDGGVKWCKHRIAASYWVLTHKLGAPIAAVLVSEAMVKGGAYWKSQHWQVADEGSDRMHDVFVKRQPDNKLRVTCRAGGLTCSHNKRLVCRHARRCIERSAARNDIQLAWTTDWDAAGRLSRFGGSLFTVVSEHGPVVYGFAQMPNDNSDDELARRRRERDNALPVQPDKKKGRMWK
jgi:hypothetical protein